MYTALYRHDIRELLAYVNTLKSPHKGLYQS